MAKPLTGSIRKNDKQGVETRPDYRGKVTMEEGQEYWVSAWINEDRDTGGKYLSLKLQPKEVQQQQTATQAAHNTSKANAFQPETDADDDLPF
jgi:uncharacterized protein (DUF736 family)